MSTKRASAGWVWLSMVLGWLLLGLGGAWFYVVQRGQAIQTARERLSTQAKFKVEQIVDWRRERIRNAHVLVEIPSSLENIRESLLHGGETGIETMQKVFLLLGEHYGFADIFLIDREGRPLLGLRGDFSECDGYLEILSEAFSRREPVMGDLHRDRSRSFPHVSIVAPVFGENGDPLGAVVLVCDARTHLYQRLAGEPIPTETVETLLLRREGEGSLFLNPTRFDPEAALALHVPDSELSPEGQEAVERGSGLFEWVDYRGIPGLAALRSVPDSHWVLVVKEDRAEFFADWQKRALLILGLWLALVVCTGLLGLSMWFRERREKTEALYLAERRQLESARRQGIILASIGDAVMVVDVRGRVEFLNAVAAQLTGWSPQDAQGRALEEVFRIVNGLSRETAPNPVARVLREGIVMGLANHTLLIARDGSERPIADSAAPVRDASGALTGVVLVFRDQSSEYQMLQRLRDSEARYRDLFEHSADATLLGKGERFIDCNQAALRMLGCDSKQEFLAIHPAQYSPPTQPDGQSSAAKLRMILARIEVEETLRFEWMHLRMNGESFPVEVTLTRIRDTDGEWLLHTVWRDLTEVKRIAKERNELDDELRQSRKIESVGRLAGGVAHDFNNMLGVIMGCTELVLNKLPDDSPLREDLKPVLHASRRSAELTRQLLAFARKQTISPKVLDLNRTLEGMTKLLRRLIGEQIEFRWLPTPGLDPVYIDPSQLDQILANLCVNARDAIRGHGKIEISTGQRLITEEACRAMPEVSPGRYVSIEVRDNGCGMPAEILDQIFEPFFTTKGVGEGTGMGLATVYGIVKQNRGFIEVASEPGRGSRFSIFIPAHLDVDGLEDVAPAADPAAIFPEGRGKSVLLVEDETAILELLRDAVLRPWGFTVYAFADPRQAIEFAAQHQDTLDLLLSDVIMPGMNGRVLTERVRAHHPGIRVLYMSGYPADVIAVQGVLATEIPFIAKPFSVAEFSAKLRELLQSPTSSA